jgi:predicted lipoprotein with Yx(FWY)xxD motif
MKTPSVATFAVLGASALLAAGCGSSKSSSSNSPSAPSTNAQSSTSSSVGVGIAVTAKHAAKLGTVLAAGPRKMTVYLFEADNGSSSKCAGACSTAWPPVITSAAPVASGGAVTAHLSTIKRADGTAQVTYNGHPLYYFVKDKDAGDSYGQGVHAFGASWYVLAPSGSKVDNS